ncbi:hypothetical protein DVH24_024476 [Malus domestica]|uniref:Bifunctional inhibitor/plant lipid transfer protein/seed storage helical domain-containing protein n=1 Tax=Malus domestica TaxID=3750 RepID=A0A498JMF9_MALDO|nr:hypothetical protein DVH24_024476 [Malus domestica]
MDRDREANTRCTWFTQIGYVHGVEEFSLIVNGLHKYIGSSSPLVSTRATKKEFKRQRKNIRENREGRRFIGRDHMLVMVWCLGGGSDREVGHETPSQCKEEVDRMRQNCRTALLPGPSCSVVLGFIILCVVMVVDADTSPSQCKQENNILISACKPVFMGQKASAYCCQRFRIMHFECVCPLVTPKLTNLINVQHTIQQIRACGKRIPHNFKQQAATVLLGFIILYMVMAAKADTSPSQCKQENNILISACKPVFMGQKASAYCC